MLFFDDLADWWDKQKREAEEFLEEFVEETGSWWAIAVAGTVQTAMDLGGGFVDVLRLGEGVRDGGWRGWGQDGLRLLSVVGPIGKGFRAVRRVFKADPNPCAGICTWVTATKALRQTGTRHFETVDELARFSDEVPSDAGTWIGDMFHTLRVRGADARLLDTPLSMEHVTQIARTHPDGVVMFSVLWKSPNQVEPAGHTLMAFRDLLGRIRIADRTGREFRRLVALEDLPQYQGIANAVPYGKAIVIRNSTVVQGMSGASMLALEVRAVLLASRKEADSKLAEIKLRRRKPPGTGHGTSRRSDHSKGVVTKARKLEAPRVHVVKPGESWESIAQQYYGDPTLGKLVAVYNQFKSGVPVGPPLPGSQILLQ